MVKVAGEKLEERLEDHVKFNREGHEFRYRLASGFATKDDTVVDAACGTGYGRQFFDCHEYVGVDRYRPEDSRAWHFECVDLETWTPDFRFDVGVSFETIEHLNDYSQLLHVLCLAKKWIVASVPLGATVGNNPWHHHDFYAGQLECELAAHGAGEWERYQAVWQPDEESDIVVMRRVL